MIGNILFLKVQINQLLTGNKWK